MRELVMVLVQTDADQDAELERLVGPLVGDLSDGAVWDEWRRWADPDGEAVPSSIVLPDGSWRRFEYGGAMDFTNIRMSGHNMAIPLLPDDAVARRRAEVGQICDQHPGTEPVWLEMHS